MLTFSFSRLLMCAFVAVSAASCCHNMASDNAKTVRDFHNAFANEWNFAKASSFVGDTYQSHAPNAKQGLESLKEVVASFQSSKSHGKIMCMVAEKDIVVVAHHITVNEKDKGYAAVDFYQLKDGKIINHWDVFQQVSNELQDPTSMFCKYGR